MAFSKAKIQRFNDIQTCAPPPGAYNPKFDDHIPGGVVYAKDKELQSPSSNHSDHQSLNSSMSLPVFRTPTIPKRKKNVISVSADKKKCSSKLFNSDKEEALREKIVECANKDETIKELGSQLDDLKMSICKLQIEKEFIEKQLKEVQNEKEIIADRLEESQNHNETICLEFEETKEKLREENSMHLKLLQENLNDLETHLKKSQAEAAALLKEAKEKLFKKEQDYEIIETELFNVKQELLELEMKFTEAVQAQDDLQKSHLSNIESLKKLHESEIQCMENENEKIVNEWKKTVAHLENENKTQLQDLQQKEETKQKQLLEENNKLKKTIDDLQTVIKNVTQELNEIKGKLEVDCITVALAEKHRYEIALNKTYNTVNALKKRLLNSDNDVEQLTTELNSLEKSKLEMENKYLEEITVLKKINQDLEHNNQILTNEIKLKVFTIQTNLLQKLDVFKSKIDTEVNRLIGIADRKQKELELLKEHMNEHLLVNKNASKLIHEAQKEIDNYESIISNYKSNLISLEDKVSNSQKEIDNLNQLLKEKGDLVLHLNNGLKEIEVEYNEIVKKYIEKDHQHEELQQKYDTLLEKHDLLEKQVAEQTALIGPFREQLENYERECRVLHLQKGEAEKEAKEMGLKYAEMLGHQNYRQKLKHMVDLKKKNYELQACKLENEAKILSQIKTIEKLKQKLSQVNKTKPTDKENVLSPRIANTRTESPGNALRERN